MARKRSFDSMNPDGNLAVNILLRDPRFGGFVAENSAAQYFSPAGRGSIPDAMAQGFLQIWLASPSHRLNVVYKEFDRAGIGIAVSGNTIYASTVFADRSRVPRDRAMRDKAAIRSYREFWPYYLNEHKEPKTRALHLAGTGVTTVLLAAGVVTANLWLLCPRPSSPATVRRGSPISWSRRIGPPRFAIRCGR